jgi:parallel beta-helix repeat protein
MGSVVGTRKGTLTILLVLTLVLVSFLKINVKAQAKTIVVPDDYPTIQEAVDFASEGGTIFVRRGSYEKIVRIRKSLSLIGENPENTIIETPNIIFSEGVIQAYSENITISGFTIRNCDMGIWVFGGCKIVGNKIENAVGWGMDISGQNNIISGNNITAKYDGIRIYSDNSIVSGNIITDLRNIGITVGSCKNLTICNNTLTKNLVGLRLSGAGPFYIYGNKITNNEAFGIQLFGCNNASIYENNIIDNSIGVVLENYNYQFGPAPLAKGSGNFFFKNNFENNQRQVVFDKTWNVGQWDLTEYYPDAINGTDSASWNKNYIGNYWSKYNGTDSNEDGIGDTPYIINENNQDNYPLIEPVFIPEFPSWAILVSNLLMITMILIIYRQKRKLSN